MTALRALRLTGRGGDAHGEQAGDGDGQGVRRVGEGRRAGKEGGGGVVGPL